MDFELLIRLLASVSIILAYISNCLSGWWIVKIRVVTLPPAKVRRRTWWRAFCFAFHPCRPLPKDTPEKRWNDSLVLAFYAPYLSVAAALTSALVHIVWLLEGGWINQPQLLPFVTVHLLIALTIHLFHLKLMLTADRAKEATV